MFYEHTTFSGAVFTAIREPLNDLTRYLLSLEMRCVADIDATRSGSAAQRTTLSSN